MPRGGRRPNAGRKKKYGDTPTIRFVRVVPVALVDDIDVAIENLVASTWLDPDDAPQLTEGWFKGADFCKPLSLTTQNGDEYVLEEK